MNNPGKNLKEIPVKTVYLEMKSPPKEDFFQPLSKVKIKELEKPDVNFYRYLYKSVGDSYLWVDRIIMPEKELEKAITSENVKIFLLEIEEKVAGYVEFELFSHDEVKIAYFGLFPEFTGRGFGKYFLQWSVKKAWSYNPKRIWLHTCELDHPGALNNYLKTGFEIFDEKIILQKLPDNSQ